MLTLLDNKIVHSRKIKAQVKIRQIGWVGVKTIVSKGPEVEVSSISLLYQCSTRNNSSNTSKSEHLKKRV